MEIVTGLALAIFVLSIIVGSVGAWYESRAVTEWQKRAGQFYAEVGAYGIGFTFLLAVVALFYQLSH